MVIIKCDMCNKEQQEYKKMKHGYYKQKMLDLCDECFIKYQRIKDEFRDIDNMLSEEYEQKRKQLYKDIIEKNSIKILE